MTFVIDKEGVRYQEGGYVKASIGRETYRILKELKGEQSFAKYIRFLALKEVDARGGLPAETLPPPEPVTMSAIKEDTTKIKLNSQEWAEHFAAIEKELDELSKMYKEDRPILQGLFGKLKLNWGQANA